MIAVKVKRLEDECGRGILPLPSYETAGAAGMDLRAAHDAVLEPGEVSSVGTGLAVEIPLGYEGQIRPRSGLALKHSITLLNSPGTVDSDYRGEVRVIMMNLGREPFAISRGDRIAQIVFCPVAQAELIEATELEDTTRSARGFGSTGIA